MSLFDKKPEPAASTDQKPEGKGVKSSERRYLVIGSSGYRGVDSLEWDADSLPNIVDYDTVIVDVRSLDQEKLKLVSHDFLVDIRTQLVRLLDSNGQVIVLTDFRRTDHRPDRYPERIDNYDWCPIDVGISDESGETIVIVKEDSRFEAYLRQNGQWGQPLKKDKFSIWPKIAI